MSTLPLYSVSNSPAMSHELETLRVELSEAQNAQQTAEIALAREREASVSEGVRTAIDDAIRRECRAYIERDRVRHDYEKAQVQLQASQLTLEKLEHDLAGLTLENRVLEQENRELTTSRLRARMTSHSRAERRRAFIEMMRYRTRSHTMRAPRGSVPPYSSHLSDEVRRALPPSDDPSFVSWPSSAHADTVGRRPRGTFGLMS